VIRQNRKLDRIGGEGVREGNGFLGDDSRAVFKAGSYSSRGQDIWTDIHYKNTLASEMVTKEGTFCRTSAEWL